MEDSTVAAVLDTGVRMGAQITLRLLWEMFPNTIDDEAKAYVLHEIERLLSDDDE